MNRKQKEEFYDMIISQAFAGEEDMLVQQQEEVAARLGVNPEDVAIKRDVLATRLAREGVILDLSIGRERFERGLSAEDLGIKSNDEKFQEFLKNYVLMGRKRLIPASYIKKLNTLDSRARYNLEEFSYKTRYGAFVPYSAYESVKEMLEDIRAEYFAVHREILDRYDEIKFITEQDYYEASVEVYRLLQKDEYAYPDPEFQRIFVQKIMQFFPSKESIEKSFYFEIKPSFVPLTSTVLEEEVRRDLIREKERLIRKELALEDMKITEEMRIQQHKEMAQLQVIEAEKETRLHEENYKREQIEKINQEVLEHHRSEMEGFFDTITGQLYGMIYEAVTSAQASVEKNGRLVGPSSKQLQKLVKKIRLLNFMKDKRVEEQLRELERIVDTDPKYRSEDRILSVLNEIALDNRQTLTLLGRKPRSARGRVVDESSDIKEELSELPARKKRVDSSAQLDLMSVFEGAEDIPKRTRRCMPIGETRSCM